MVSLDDVSARLHSFVVVGAMESADSLQRRLVESYLADILVNFHKLAGNVFGKMKIIGRPVGLYRNIGGGVKDFFYEVCTTCLGGCYIIICVYTR